MDGVSRVRINHKEAMEIHHLFNHDPIVYMCRQLLLSTLLSGGIACEQNGVPAKEEFMDLLNTHWLSFTRDLIFSFLMFGYCPVLVDTVPVARQKNGKQKRQKRTAQVPISPPFGVYGVDLCMDLSNYKQTLHFIPTCGTQSHTDPETNEDTRVTMLVSDDGMPNLSRGCHQSRLSTLLPKYRFMQRLMKYAIQAEHIRSHPPLITQDNADKRPVNETLTEEAFGDPEELFKENEERRYRKNASNMNAMFQQRDMARSLNQNEQFIMDPFAHDASGFALSQTYHDNTYHIPDGMQMAPNGPMPQVRSDLTDLERMRIDIVCGCFGVPKSLIMADNGRSNGSGASEVEYRLLMRTVDNLSAMVVRALEQVYKLIYGDDSVTFSLPIIPMTSIDTIATIYDRGIISRETQGNYLLRACGLPLTDLELQEETPPSDTNDEIVVSDTKLKTDNEDEIKN